MKTTRNDSIDPTLPLTSSNDITVHSPIVRLFRCLSLYTCTTCSIPTPSAHDILYTYHSEFLSKLHSSSTYNHFCNAFSFFNNHFRLMLYFMKETRKKKKCILYGVGGWLIYRHVLVYGIYTVK